MINSPLQIIQMLPLNRETLQNLPPKGNEHIRMTIDKIDHVIREMREDWVRRDVLRDRTIHHPFFFNPLK